jgi:hypothetical protein
MQHKQYSENTDDDTDDCLLLVKKVTGSGTKPYR